MSAIALLAVGFMWGLIVAAVAQAISAYHETMRTVRAWRDYEQEERRSWRESRTQKERKAHASWN